uniref:Uncharacterized protein n=1 Tax=Arundo donax TaxID=35708 RepID=A0A0A9GD27_ARUDO
MKLVKYVHRASDKWEVKHTITWIAARHWVERNSLINNHLTILLWCEFVRELSLLYVIEIFSKRRN